MNMRADRKYMGGVYAINNTTEIPGTTIFGNISYHMIILDPGRLENPNQ
jgi:hypothetical protein